MHSNQSDSGKSISGNPETPIADPSADPILHIVLYEPQIPQNTGNIGRSCAALGAKLWIVRPAAFRLDAAQVRRAGLDYWKYVNWEAVDNWDELCRRLDRNRMWLITKFGTQTYWDASFSRGDVLVFGRETTGLPDSLRAEFPDRGLSIPMPGPVRSLNLSTSAGIVMFEAVRQLSGAGAFSCAAPARTEMS